MLPVSLAPTQRAPSTKSSSLCIRGCVTGELLGDREKDVSYSALGQAQTDSENGKRSHRPIHMQMKQFAYKVLFFFPLTRSKCK